jgi:hypothetical protein
VQMLLGKAWWRPAIVAVPREVAISVPLGNRSWLGWDHRTAMVTAAYGLFTLERLSPPPSAVLTPPKPC